MMEKDKYGVELGKKGCKLDAGKVELSFAYDQFPNALECIARVGMHGAYEKGYGKKNWITVEDGINRYREAELRHQNWFNKGQIIDKDSGLPHKWHIAWNRLAQLELEMLSASTPEKN